MTGVAFLKRRMFDENAVRLLPGWSRWLSPALAAFANIHYRAHRR